MSDIPGKIVTLDEEQIDLDAVDDIIDGLPSTSDATIAILQAIQARFRHLPKAALVRVCERTAITPAQIAGVSTFFDQFRHRPAGEHLVRICHGTACHVKGAPLVHDALLRHLGIPEDGDTDAQRLVTVEKVACLGCCTLAPVMQVDGITYGHLTPSAVGGVLDDFLELEEMLEELRDIREAQIALEEWRRDPSTARPWEEVKADLIADGLLDE